MTSSTAFAELRNNLEMMYTNKLHTDLKLKAETEVFHVHKCILSARSPVFRAMFNHNMAESKTGIINITDVSAKIIEIFLKYLYTGSLGHLMGENVLNLMLVAEKYAVRSLKEDCSAYLISTLSEENVCDILNTADIVSERHLKSFAIKFIKEHADKVLLSDNWKAFVTNNVILASETLSKLSTDFGSIAIGKKETERKSKSSTSQQFPTVSAPSTSRTPVSNGRIRKRAKFFRYRVSR